MKKSLEILLLLLALPPLPLHAAGIPVTGRVLTPDGKPAAGVRAVLVPELPTFESSGMELAGKAGPAPVASVATGADGSFRLLAPDTGMWTVRLEGAGLMPLEAPLLPLTEETELSEARLVPDAGLQVKVTDPQGKPVANAWVRVESPRGFSFGGDESWRTPLRRVAFTDANGVATVPRTRNEVLSVWAAAPGYLPAGQEKVHGSAASLRLAAGVTRGIEVRDARGTPAAGVLAAFRDSAWVAGRTAESGRLDLAIPAAGADLRLAAADGRWLEYRLRAAKPEEKGPAVIVLPPATPASGRVVAEGGKPAPGALVWLDRDLGDLTRAGKDGTFRLSHLSEETRVLATAPGFLTEDGRAADGRSLTFTLQPRLKASGIVVDEAGHPVAGASLKASPVLSGQKFRNPAAWRSSGSARSAASGRFQISTLVAEVAYELRVQRQGFAPARAEIPARQAGAPAPDLRVVLHPGRTAIGMVIDGSRRPVAGAGVTLRPNMSGDPLKRMREIHDPLRLPAVTTDAAGRFAVKGLPPGTFDLTIRARGFAPLTVPALGVPEGNGTTDLGTVQLAPGGSVQGVVVDAQGEPVADAEVRARSGGRDQLSFFLGEEGPDSVFTAADGSFTLENLAPGVRIDLAATHPGYGPGAAPGVAVPAEGPVRIVLQRVSRVSGRVTGPDGKPVTGAAVALNESGRGFGGALFDLARRPLHQGTTDDEGGFSFADVAAGPFGLSAQAPRHQRAELKGLEVKPGEDLAGVEIVLPAAAAVEGRVLAADGSPIEDAEVMVAAVSRSGSPSFSTLRDSTDAEGRYRIEEIPPGPHTLEAHAEGYRRAVRDVETGTETRQVDFRLERGQGEVSGRVIDDAGSPVAEASVVLYGGAGESRVEQSAADGSFRIVGVDDGTYNLRAGKVGYGSFRLENELKVAGAPVSGIEVRLSAADGTIKGRLTGLEFSQLSRVRVSAESAIHTGIVDADGGYRIEHLQPGEWKVSAVVPDTPLHAEGSVTLERGTPEAHLDLQFGGGRTLSGTVLRNGQPLVAAVLLLARDGAGESQRSSTDHQGGFRFGGLEDGNYSLGVATPNGAWHQEKVEISGDRTIEVELRTASLSGRVLDAADGSPVPGARIYLQGPEGGESVVPSATTDARGAFHLPEVGEGDWTVQAAQDGYAQAERKVEVEGDRPPGDVEIRLEPTEGVTVEALLASGQPPDHIRVVALDGAGATVASGSYPTGENGRTRIPNLPPGSWLLLVEAAQSGPATVAVSSPGPAARVILPPAGQVDLQVPALAERPAAAMAVLTGPGGPYRDIDGDGSVKSEWDLAAGRRSFDRVPAGTWQVVVRAADGRSWSGTATVTPGGVAAVELR